jgi:hypothetical protein
MPRAGIYPLSADFGVDPGADLLEMDPYWVIAIIRLGEPLSFNRKKMKSDSTDLSAGALLRADEPLVITSDCLSMNVTMSKNAETKSMNATLKQADINYLIEIIPGDWVMAWMVNNRTDFEDLLSRIGPVASGANTTDSCNNFNDGLKFVGRVDDIYKDTTVIPKVGTKISNYNLKCTGFSELNTYMYYDYALATSDAQGGNFGWMARFGVSTDALFGSGSEDGIEQNNINNIIPILLNMVLGKGPDKKGDITLDGEGGNISATPQLSDQNEKGRSSDNDPPFSYLVPVSVGNLLGKRVASKGLMSYADILELWTGVQSYANKNGPSAFTPEFNYSIGPNRRIMKGGRLLGTFLPFMPDFANRPLWGVLQQYVNHTINEIYTAMKVNPEGKVVPTIVFRQIPFTTDVFTFPPSPAKKNTLTTDELTAAGHDSFLIPTDNKIATTKFLDLPRWHIPSAMVKHVHVGRSNATRTNFVHIYGTATNLENGGTPQQYQMLINPPVRDDVDIFRAGCRTHVSHVDCWVDDTVGKVPGQWMALVADWMMGSHLTLNGMIDLYGVQAPVAEGDNVLFDGVVYHVMQVDHYVSMDTEGGNKQFGTILHLTNGMRDQDVDPAINESDLGKGLQPIYPGFDPNDNTQYDPGLTLTGDRTTGGITKHKERTEDPKPATDVQTKSPLNHYDTEAAIKKGEVFGPPDTNDEALKDLL